MKSVNDYPVNQPLVKVPIPKNATAVNSGEVLRVATQNNLSCLAAQANYELLLKDYAALQIAIADYVARYTKLSEEKSTSSTDSKK